MRVLYVASEIYPWVKTGGLADVTASLPPALARAGVDVRLFLPGLPAIVDSLQQARTAAELGAAFGAPKVRVLAGRLPGCPAPAYVLDAPVLYDRPGNPYVDERGRDYADNHRRFALLGWAAAHFFDGRWRADVLHAHDWHAGLAPAWLATFGGPRPASVFTIHNLAFQGLVPADQAPELGLPGRFFDIDGIEFHGQASFMKAGLYFADRLTTVSPTYAREIQSAPAGMGLEGLLSGRADDLDGIVNGVDTEVWNPAADAHLPFAYTAADPAPKVDNKAALQAELGLAIEPTAPLFCLVSRLTEQKGLDLIAAALPAIVAAGGQFALLGSGDGALEAALRREAEAYPARVSVTLGYDEALSHRLIGAADLIAVPSRYEPCGLTQLYGLRYGTLPVVTPVGGLADTVIDSNRRTLADGSATGFVVPQLSAQATIQTVERAMATYRRVRDWDKIRGNAMAADFGWDRSAARYAALYAALAPAADSRTTS
ncbi:glycogen synthase GlgA [Salinisphaera sp.]|uniref:glycogen synthase GlgA n=1 Tax=Salinisphaera sp. TaxID=1914330 RepID=UPI002D79681B|nr:glycogen synthase GlgA [Salinisphaera sp.]HET7314779.1 glycogen synthase GlgA [Salinisphaera sp.]